MSSSKQWKEMRAHADPGEQEPLTSGASGKGNKRVPEDEPDIWETGFTLREFSQAGIRTWLGFQIVALLFQVRLWSEVSWHLREYDDTIHAECAPEHREHGVCSGPMWKLSSYQDTVLGGNGWRSERRQWQFSTLSDPPTFLIAIDPVARSKDEKVVRATSGELTDDTQDVREARWSLEVTRINPPHVGGAFTRHHSGQQAITFEDFSEEAKEALGKNHRVEWQATLISKGSSAWKTRYLSFVEDAAMPHLAMVHNNPTCAFGRSWKAFTEHHQGSNHRALTWCSFLLGWFLVIGAGAVYVVHREASSQYFDGRSFNFHLFVIAKFFLQDMPQQICIVLYIYGWYEASGLRCQLCLFRPEHCGHEQPFHLANILAFGCTLLSATANQILIRPVFKRKYSEDDICLQYCIRIGGLCIAVLPFTTAMCFASRSLIPIPTFFHVAFAVPCGLGWFALAGSVCFPLLVCCDEDY